MKRLIGLILVLAMMMALVACGSTEETASADSYDHDSVSAAIYDDIFGEFYDYYEDALSAENVSERYALMAQAEAKLLDTFTTVPTTTQGGYYSISRVAPYTVSSIQWGLDSYRYHNVVVTTEPITAKEREEMKAKWEELRGTGKYEEWAASYLEKAGYTLKDTYSQSYADDPATWDTLATSLSVDCEAICNTYDGLVEYDMENEMQPALAESWEVSDDGLTYTFKLREGVKWVDSQGREVGEVTADDFVAGLQHMMDTAGGLEYLVGAEGAGIVNADAYINGDVTDFDEVGVKAVDDYTLEYTLEAPCSYFLTMLPYSVFAPMNREYYESKGGKFGSEFDDSASDYTYGSDPDNIAYCGPYIVTNSTAKNKIVFSANESYYKADDIRIKTITWVYQDDSDATKRYKDMKKGTIDGTSLNTASVKVAKSDDMFDTYCYASLTDATTFQAYYNLNRQAFANFNDDTKVVSEQTDEDAQRTNAAMQNKNFRKAISLAFDRASYNAQSVGEDLKYNSLRNTITPGNFVALEEETTITIDDEDVTFPAGTYYGEIVQAQLDADDAGITVWKDDTSDGFDGWYDADAAVEALNDAIDELAEDGVEISEDNPIYIDLPYPSSVEEYTNKANAYKKSLEKVLGGKVIVNLVAGNDEDEWLYAGYYTDYGYEMNYDMYDCSGWSPDYGDPATYLGCYLPDYSGYMEKCFGIY